MSNIISKLNWRLMVVHLIACWFFIYSFMLFLDLYDFKYLMGLIYHPNRINLDMERISIDMLWSQSGRAIGLFTAFLISLTISIKQKWHWLNSLIVFIVGLTLLRYDLFGWRYLKVIFLKPGSFFNFESIWFFIINGIVMLIIGLLLFFSKWTAQFIKPREVLEGNEQAIN